MLNVFTSRAQVMSDPRIPHHLIGDPSLISRVLYNLVYDAYRSTESGLVTVRTTCFSCVVKHSDSRVMIGIEVVDTGRGMLADEVKAIIEAPAGGTAMSTLGLSFLNARNLVLAYGGDFSLKSDISEGTCCSVRMSLMQASDSEISESNSSCT